MGEAKRAENARSPPLNARDWGLPRRSACSVARPPGPPSTGTGTTRNGHGDHQARRLRARPRCSCGNRGAQPRGCRRGTATGTGLPVASAAAGGPPGGRAGVVPADGRRERRPHRGRVTGRKRSVALPAARPAVGRPRCRRDTRSPCRGGKGAAARGPAVGRPCLGGDSDVPEPRRPLRCVYRQRSAGGAARAQFPVRRRRRV